jgi:L-lactate dehydrogenase
MDSVADDIIESKSEAILIVVANPVDILTRRAVERTGWPRERVFGSGTVLDTSRFRWQIGDTCAVNAHDVHGFVLGEHGDSEMFPWSLTHIAGLSMDEYCRECGECDDIEKTHADIEKAVRQSAYHIINYKGATNYAVGLALMQITNAVLRNEHRILSVSLQLRGEYGLHDMCLSVPCLVSGQGIEKILEATLSDTEYQALKQSAETLEQAWQSIEK